MVGSRCAAEVIVSLCPQRDGLFDAQDRAHDVREAAVMFGKLFQALAGKQHMESQTANRRQELTEGLSSMVAIRTLVDPYVHHQPAAIQFVSARLRADD